MVGPRATAQAHAHDTPLAPPHRPQGPEPRSRGNGATSSLIRSLRIAVDQALDEWSATWIPRINRYPY